MDALCLVDTFGVLSPDAVRYFARRTKEHIKKPLETHFHMDYGLGVINTIVALTNGADTAHCTITGIGERAGNAPTEDLVMALLTLYGVDVGIKTEKLYELSQEVRRLANHSVPSNRQVVGDNLFAIESGNSHLMVQERRRRASYGGVSIPPRACGTTGTARRTG